MKRHGRTRLRHALRGQKKHQGEYRPPIAPSATVDKPRLKKKPEASWRYGQGYRASKNLVLGWDIDPSEAIVAIDALRENKIDVGLNTIGLRESLDSLLDDQQARGSMEPSEVEQWTDGFVSAMIDRLERIAGLREQPPGQAKMDREVHKLLVLNLRPGAKVIANGYPGSVVRVTPYEMIEVRLPGGVAVLDVDDVTIPGVSKGNSSDSTV